MSAGNKLYFANGSVGLDANPSNPIFLQDIEASHLNPAETTPSLGIKLTITDDADDSTPVNSDIIPFSKIN